MDATGALGRLHGFDQKYATIEKMLSRLFDWADRHPKHFKWYGMINFGDTLTWWRDEDESLKYKEYCIKHSLNLKSKFTAFILKL